MAYGQICSTFTSNCVRHQWSISSCLLDSMVQTILLHAIKMTYCPGIELLLCRCLAELKHFVDLVMPSVDMAKLQHLLDPLTWSASMIGMHLAPSKCTPFRQNWTYPAPSFIILLLKLKIHIFGQHRYLKRLCGCRSSSSFQKARVVFVNVRRWDIHLIVKGGIYAAFVRLVPLYRLETHPLHTEDFKRLLLFDDQCLCTITRAALLGSGGKTALLIE